MVKNFAGISIFLLACVVLFQVSRDRIHPVSVAEVQTSQPTETLGSISDLPTESKFSVYKSIDTDLSFSYPSQYEGKIKEDKKSIFIYNKTEESIPYVTHLLIINKNVEPPLPDALDCISKTKMPIIPGWSIRG